MFNLHEMESDNDSDEFVRRLIEAVKKRKCIYNKKAPTYYNKQEREKAWGKVAAEVRQSATTCQKRWKLLREKYAKELKKRDRALADGQNYHSNWSCFSKINFIEDQIKPRSTRNSKCRYYFVPAFRHEDNKLPKNDDSDSNKSLPHSTNPSPPPQDHTIDIIHFQPTLKQDCSEELNNYSPSENSTVDNDHVTVKDELSNTEPVDINDLNQQHNEMEEIEKLEAIAVQQKIQEWLKVNCFDPLYADASNAEKAKQEQSKILTKEADDSDALFGKMVTTMLKDIQLEDVKDDVKLNILQLLIQAKRVVKNSSQG